VSARAALYAAEDLTATENRELPGEAENTRTYRKRSEEERRRGKRRYTTSVGGHVDA
jgi:hypothetical protein